MAETPTKTWLTRYNIGFILALFVLIGPALTYFITFGWGWTTHSKWAEMGTFFSGMYTPILSLFTAIFLFIQIIIMNKQTSIQEKQTLIQKEQTTIEKKQATIQEKQTSIQNEQLDFNMLQNSRNIVIEMCVHLSNLLNEPVDELKKSFDDLRKSQGLEDENYDEIMSPLFNTSSEDTTVYELIEKLIKDSKKASFDELTKVYLSLLLHRVLLVWYHVTYEITEVNKKFTSSPEDEDSVEKVKLMNIVLVHLPRGAVSNLDTIYQQVEAPSFEDVIFDKMIKSRN